MRLIRMTALAVAVALSGCAAKVLKTSETPVHAPVDAGKSLVLQVTGEPGVIESSDWAMFKGELRGALAAESAAMEIPFSTQSGEQPPANQVGTLLSVHVNDYRYMTSGQRFAFGALAGNAFVDAKVRFIDLKTGLSFGEQTINTSSSAWEGVFSAMSNDQLRAIARDLMADIKPR